MARGTALPKCDWGLDYQLGSETPVEYVRKALALGRLNVLYSFHLLIAGDKDGAVHSLTTGLHFSHDVANGGTLFATLIGEALLIAHFNGVEFVLHMGGISDAQRRVLRYAIAQLGPAGLDWQSAMKRELQISQGTDSRSSAALARIIPAYLSAMKDPSMLPRLQQVIASAPRSLQDVIPNPKRVLEAKQDLTDKLQKTRSSLQ
jgi:hypothetical protein